MKALGEYYYGRFTFIDTNIVQYYCELDGKLNEFKVFADKAIDLIKENGYNLDSVNFHREENQVDFTRDQIICIYKIRKKDG